MLVNFQAPLFAYMEIPRTGSTTVDRALRNVFPRAKAPGAKHWPLPWQKLAPQLEGREVTTLITVRNPYRRAVSCWQFFTDPSRVSFATWLQTIRGQGFVDINIEAQPQSLWWGTQSWDHVLHTETLAADFNKFLRAVGQLTPGDPDVPLKRRNKTGEWVNRVGVVAAVETHDLRDHYSPVTRPLVEELYSSDFELGQRQGFDWSLEAACCSS